MRPYLFFALLVVLVGSAPSAGGQARIVWPDPIERAALQRQEYERGMRIEAARRAPADARSLLQDRFDVSYYRLDLDLREMASEWLRGELTAELQVTAGPLDTLLFDLHDNLVVDSAFVAGRPVAFVQDWYDLRILPETPLTTNQRVDVRIRYQGHPVETGEVAFTFGMRDGINTVWTLSEPFGAREWWPCKDRPDDKADSLDVIVHVPEPMFVTSNGVLVANRIDEDGSRTFHWKHRYPITTYLVCVNATNYVRIEDRYIAAPGDTLMIEHFVYSEEFAAALEDFSITAEAIGVLAELFGPYPFFDEKYGHSMFPWGGGMEHQTNTSYGAGLVQGNHRYDYILVHELAHQWWGDMTSPADWRDIWLNEGFASYAEALWAERLGGSEALQDYMVLIQRVSEPSGHVYDPRDLFDPSVVYNKGAWVLHMLRGVLGDSLFSATLAEYRARTAFRSTTSAEFQAIAEEVAHRDLDFFFDPWLYGTGRPSYAVSFLSIGEPGLPRVAIHLAETQKGLDSFPMPVDLLVNLEGGGSVRLRMFNDTEHEDLEADLPDVPVGVVVDPDDWILKQSASSAYGLNITTTALPDGRTGDPFTVSLQGRGGTPPYAWSTQGAPPESLSLDPATGLLSGTAPDSGVYSFYVTLMDHVGAYDTQRYRWVVNPEPQDTTVVPVPSALSLKIGPIPAQKYAYLYVAGPVEAPVAVSIYDLGGREVRRLYEGPIPDDRSIPWNGRDDREHEVASGVYIVRLTGAGSTITQRLVWMR